VIAVAGSILGFVFGVTMMNALQTAQQQANAFQMKADAKARENESLLRQIEELVGSTDENQHWIVAFKNADKINQLPRGQAIEAMKRTWAELKSVHAKQQFLKSINVSDSPDTHLGLHLGMQDESPQVNSWACIFLTDIALFDVAAHRERYEVWYEEHKHFSTGEAILSQLRKVEADVKKAIQHDDYQSAANRIGKIIRRTSRFELITENEELARQARGMSFSFMAIEIINQTKVNLKSRRSVAYLLKRIPLEASFVREQIVPILPTVDTGLLSVLAGVIAQQPGEWATDALFDEMRRQLAAGVNPYKSDIPESVAERDDPAAIPLMIAWIDADNTYDTIYGVGHFGLGILTGVEYDKSHDGMWWRKWWDENKDRYKLSDDEKKIPSVKLVAKPKQAAEKVVPFKAGDNPKMRYLLHASPDANPDFEGKMNLLLVMPGGDGDSDFAPFVKNIAENCLPENWVIAQLIAPIWDEQQMNKLVWPTETNPYDKMKFSTEAFAKSVITDFRKRWTPGVDQVHMLAWSSGGPAAYACLLNEDRSSETAIDGALIAMSVYKPNQLPKLDTAKGKKLYLLHSPDDFIKMWFPELAIKQFSAAGAKTKLTTYAGGHGWHGDLFGNIRKGIEWLSIGKQ